MLSESTSVCVDMFRARVSRTCVVYKGEIFRPCLDVVELPLPNLYRCGMGHRIASLGPVGWNAPPMVPRHGSHGTRAEVEFCSDIFSGGMIPWRCSDFVDKCAKRARS